MKIYYVANSKWISFIINVKDRSKTTKRIPLRIPTEPGANLEYNIDMYYNNNK